MTTASIKRWAETRDRNRFAFEVGRLRVPNNVELNSNFLVCNVMDDLMDDSLREVRTDKGLLLDFAYLAEKSNDDVLQFAKKWGMLELCKHQQPATHNLIYAPPDVQAQFVGQVEEFCCYPTGRESIDSWRAYARECRTLLEVAGNLYGGTTTDRSTWRYLFDRLNTGEMAIDLPSMFLDSLTSSGTEELQVYVLSEFVNRWLRLSDVRPGFVWEGTDKSPQITFETRSVGKLFAALAIQLMVAISGSDGPVICSSCARPYYPNRRPRAREAHYCGKCGRREAQREASKRHRANKKKPLSERTFRQNKKANPIGNLKTKRLNPQVS